MKQRSFLSLVFSLALVGLLLGALTPAGATPPPPPAGVVSQVSTPQQLSFTLHVPSFSLSPQGQLVADGLNAQPHTAGMPNLPYYKTLIALPPQAEVEIKVQERSSHLQTISSISPVPHTETEGEITNTPASLDELTTTYHPNPEIYGQNSFYPAASYHLSPPASARYTRFVELHLFPLRYNPITQELLHVSELSVEITFVGGENSGKPAGTYSPGPLDSLVLNPEYLPLWSLPSAAAAPLGGDVHLPVGQTAYKILVDQQGIYELSYSSLVALGLTGTVPTTSLQMMHDGQSVAFEVVDSNSNGLFDSNDRVRFYGWPFTGPRSEKHYVTDNVFWLWVNGTAQIIPTQISSNTGTIITSTARTENFEDDNVFYTTIQSTWDGTVNDNPPDFWYWDHVFTGFSQATNSIVTRTFPITLTHPIATAPADLTVELQNRQIASDPNLFNNVVININGLGQNFTTSWFKLSKHNRNISHIVPVGHLQNGANTVTIRNNDTGSLFYVNRIEMSYLSGLTATNNQLIFPTQVTGTNRLRVNGLTTNTVLVWDVSNPTQPVRISGTQISGSAGNFTATFGRNLTSEGQFIVTTSANLLPTTGRVSAYQVNDIDFSTDEVSWLAISYADFIPEINRLATHRANLSHFNTRVVDVEDVINQYGYGMPSYKGIHTYLQTTFSWETAPQYALLVGDSAYDARLLDCGACVPNFVNPDALPYDFRVDEINYVPTYYEFQDRFQGMVASDHPYTLLVGDDDYADIALGRLSVSSVEAAALAVDKIILYEQNLLTPADSQLNILFLHDNTDSGGDFEASNNITIGHIPPQFNITHTGLITPGSPSAPHVVALRDEFTTYMQTNTPSIINWRGHGAVDRWAGEEVLSTGRVADIFSNVGHPTISLSMDCLDGNFAFPDWVSLSETLIRADNNRGSAAHWSSTGLGFIHEHLILAEGFYVGLFDEEIVPIGDVINYTKAHYLSEGQHPSEAYSFLLQGDPAMQIFKPELTLDLDVAIDVLTTGEPITLTITNTGILPSRPLVTYTLPAGTSYITHTSTISTALPAETFINGNNETVIVFTFLQAIPTNSTAQIILLIEGDPAIFGMSHAVVSGAEVDISPADGLEDFGQIGEEIIITYPLYLPIINRP